MPSYIFSCSDCKKVFSCISTISERNKPIICECGGIAQRDIEAELAPGKLFRLVTDHERWSTSAGVPASQVDEFRKRFPNSVYDNQGRLLIRNRRDKLRQIKERNMVELDNKS